MKRSEFSFCESVLATPYSKWHIRKLTEAGQKLGGGADTLSLCGKKMAWDIEVELSDHHLSNNACEKCFEKFKEEQKGIWKKEG